MRLRILVLLALVGCHAALASFTANVDPFGKRMNLQVLPSGENSTFGYDSAMRLASETRMVPSEGTTINGYRRQPRHAYEERHDLTYHLDNLYQSKQIFGGGAEGTGLRI